MAALAARREEHARTFALVGRQQRLITIEERVEAAGLEGEAALVGLEALADVGCDAVDRELICRVHAVERSLARLSPRGKTTQRRQHAEEGFVGRAVIEGDPVRELEPGE